MRPAFLKRTKDGYKGSNAVIILVDGDAWAVDEGCMIKFESTKLDSFVESSLVPIAQGPNEMLIELKKPESNEPSKFKFKAQTLFMTPNIFGQGLSLFIDGTCVADLSIEALKALGPCERTFH